MTRARTTPFDPELVLSKVGKGKTTLLTAKKHSIFSQGDAAEAVFYIQTGKVKLTVVSQQGKEAVTRFWSRIPFLGKGVSPGSWCAWPRRPLRKTPLSCALKKPQ